MKNSTLVCIKLLLFLGVSLAIQLPVFATHITGAELTYECINPATQQYRVNVTVYRDCLNGQANFDNNIRLFIFRGSNGTLYNTNSIPLVSSGIQIIPVEWDACTGAPFNLCIEYTTYSTVITLPPLAGGYNLAWARCCRNNVVTNIVQNQGITVLGHVPSLDVPGCNSMPVFNSLPPIFLCVGQSFNFDHSATDADGDSLVYSISNPYSGVNFAGAGATQFNPIVTVGGFFNNPMGPPPYNNINFLAGYSFTDPFASGNFNMDPQSGLLTLTPTQTGLSVFAVSVKEYRNGVLLSENKRDFQINVINCAPQGIQPVIDSPPQPNGGDTIRVAPLESFCYNVDVTDPDPTDTVILFPVSAAFGVGNTAPPPFATLNYTGTNPAIGTVCWTPPCENEGDTVLLIVGGRDTSDCPGYNIVFDTTWVIIDTFANPVLSHTIVGGGGGSNDTVVLDALTSFCYDFDATDLDPNDTLEIVPISGPFQGLGGTPPFATLNYNGVNPLDGQICWTPDCNSAGKTATFIIAAQDANFCNKRDYDTVTVIVNPLPLTGVNADTIMCLGDSYQLQAFGGTAYNWTPNFGLSNNTIANPVATPGGSISYSVTITDSVGCPQNQSVSISVNPLPNADAGLDEVKCPNTSVQLNATGGIQYSWSPTNGLNDPNIPNPLASSLDTVTYTVTVIDGNGCVNTDQMTVTPMYAVPGPDQVICAGDSIQIGASGGISYSWNPGSSLNNPFSQNPFASPLTTTAYSVVVTGATGCIDSTQITVTVNQLPPASAGSDTDICIGGNTQLQASGGINYVWSPSTGLSDPSISNPIADPVLSTAYEVIVTDANGCVDRDSVFIQVNPLPIPFAGNDTIKCGNTGIQLTATGGVGYSWTPALGLNNSNSATPIANPDSTTMYTVTVTDINGCQNEDSVLVTALHADAGTDEVICIGESVQLEAQGGLSYSWDNAATLSDPNVPNPIAFPSVSTTYTVTVTFPTGCTDTDQVQVVVNPLPNADAGPIQPLCIGDTLQLQASGGVNYVWTADPTLDNPLISNPRVFPLDTTSYYVTITDANGCVNSDSTTVLVNLLPIVDAGNDTAKCGEVGVQLAATGGIGFQWTPVLGLDNPSIGGPVANPDSSTQYYVAVTDTNGCVNSDSVFVRAMYADAGPDLQVCIGDSLSLFSTGGISYQWDPSADLLNLNSATPLAFPLTTTDFYVTVTDITGCTDRDTVQLVVNPLPTTSTSGSDPYVCSGGGTQVFATGGVNYLWFPAGIFSDPLVPDPIASPTYSGATLDSTWRFYVLVTDANGCESLDSLDQVVRILPIISVSNDTVKCPGDTISLTASGGVQYDWTPTYALGSPNVATTLAFPDTTTTYQALVTAVWGCADSATVTVDVINPQAGPDVTICAEGSIQLQASGGVSYQWDNAASLSNANVANPIAFPLVTTDYIVTVTDSAGCVDVDTVTVFVNQLPPANAGPDTAICIGDTIQFLASGGTSYQWLVTDSMNNPFVPNPSLDPTVSNTYVVLVTDGNGCMETDSMDLTVNLLPLADAGPDVTKCGEDSIQLQASGGIQYVWTPSVDLSNPAIANPMAEPDSNATYSVTVTDINGCVNTDTMNILTMYADAGVGDTICFADTIQLGASHIGGLAVAYSWSPDSSIVDATVANPFVYPQVSTDYIVTVTDSSGCADTNLVHIEVLPPPPANAGGDLPLCIFDSVQLNATGGIAYDWSPALGLSSTTIANPIAFPVDTTTYFVTVTDTNGCTAVDDIIITVNPLPIVDAGPDLVKCGEQSVQLQATGGVNYLWGPSVGLSNESVADPFASPDSNTQYTVIVTDTNGCVNVDSMWVTTMYADAGPDQLKCPEDDVQLQASTIGGTGISYFWTPASDLSSSIIDNPTASPIVTTTYTVEIRDVSGCTDTASVRVNVHLPPPAFAGEDTSICIGDQITLQASGGIIFEWTPAVGLSSTTIANPVASPTLTSEYLLTVTDVNGCQETDNILITVNELPNVNAGENMALCRRDFVQLQATGATQYQWQPAVGLDNPSISNPQASPDMTTTYTVIGIDNNGCVNRDDVDVTVFQLPVISAEDYYEICVGQEIPISVEGGSSHIWSTGQRRDQIKVSPAFTETFWAIPLSEDGCEGDTFYIEVYVERELPRAEFRPSEEEGFYPFDVLFENQSRNATRYFWDFGDGNVSEEVDPMHTFNLPGEYEVRLTVDNEIGCPNEYGFQFIRALDFNIFFPNAFTPNGDGINDEYHAVMNSIERFEIQIFNRWGQRVFQSFQPDFRWNGTLQNGQPAPEGSYVFKANAVTFKGEQLQRAGSITLLR